MLEQPAKEFVLERYPNSFCCRYGWEKPNYIVLSPRERLSTGDTESEAWKNAKDKIKEMENIK